MHVHPVAKFAGRGLPSPSGLLRGPPRTMITKVAGLADLLGGFRGLVIECTRGCFNIQAHTAQPTQPDREIVEKEGAPQAT